MGFLFNRCEKCGEKFFIGNVPRPMVKKLKYCPNCIKDNPELAPPEHIRGFMDEYYERQFSHKDFEVGRDPVVIIAKGDTEMELYLKVADKYNYELINMSQSQDNWSLLETKRTLIFKKRKET